METARSAEKQPDTVCEQAQLEKLERLEQEYLRLTHTQNNAEVQTRTRLSLRGKRQCLVKLTVNLVGVD